MPGYQDLPRGIHQIFILYYFFKQRPPEEVVDISINLNVPVDLVDELNATNHVIIFHEPIVMQQDGINRTPHRQVAPDSDNSGISEPEPSELLNRVRWYYRQAARVFLPVFRLAPLNLNDVYSYMHLNRIAPTDECQAILFPFNCLKVTIAHRRVVFEISNSANPNERHAVMYMSAGDGGSISSRGYFCTYRNIKYQTLAAKDFLFLVQHPQLVLSSLTFDIASRGRRPNQYPFTSFLGKIKRYLERLQRPINVKSFIMKFFQNPQDYRTRNQGMVMKVLPFLNPDTLIRIELRVLDGTPKVNLNSGALRTCAQWRACLILDVADSKILIKNFQQIAGFPLVAMMWREGAYRKLFEELSGNILHRDEVLCQFPMRIEDAEEAHRYRQAIERVVEQCRLAGILQERHVRPYYRGDCIYIRYLRL